MKRTKVAIVGLLLLATCNEVPPVGKPSNLESSHKALGKVPLSDVATWQQVGLSTLPRGRELPAVAFDEKRRVVVLFGGSVFDFNTSSYLPSKETWEWNPQTGKWTRRIGTGAAPDARTGASMVFDSARGRFVLFGGSAGNGIDLEDTWEWEPVTGVWTKVTPPDSHPSARTRHGMVYEKGTGKILLFGGGTSDPSSIDGSYVALSLGETWEYAPATFTWKQATVTPAPSVRHDFGMVWDSARGKAVLFGGIQADIPGATGIPKQDTWEWDPAAPAWTERTLAGSNPSQRFGHGLAYDGKRGKVLLFGGFDVDTGGCLNDLWELEPKTAQWTKRLTGAESGLPSPRIDAFLVSDDVSGLLELVSGDGSDITLDRSTPEIWELDPVEPAFAERTVPPDEPSSRFGQALAYNPTRGKTYLFGGVDPRAWVALNDLWEWDGQAWAEVPVPQDARPPGRYDTALAYDPVRKSLILFGGDVVEIGPDPFGDTWEFGSNGQWTQLKPSTSPQPRRELGMVTDTTRGKILLFGGLNNYTENGPRRDVLEDVWEWDGNTMTWTDRTATALASFPSPSYPYLTYDEGRRSMVLFRGNSQFAEWDPITAGWASRDIGDSFDGNYALIAYDSIRRRQIILTAPGAPPENSWHTWELDIMGPTLYSRATTTAPGCAGNCTPGGLAFDSRRGVLIYYGSPYFGGGPTETWEYKVTNLDNGEGCTAAFASSCASGLCVEGVCCDVAACTGTCMSCNVPGAEGTCVRAIAGTEVPGSCADGKACDSAGACNTKNGQPCITAADCASGYCIDDVCCDSACAGTCMSCRQTGRAGACAPYAANTDPQGECGQGTGKCKSTCDGVGACAYPTTDVTCASCQLCNGSGDCTVHDLDTCGNTGGASGNTGGTSGGSGGASGGTGGASGGTGGTYSSAGGSGGSSSNVGGNDAEIPHSGGAGGTILATGGAAGGITAAGGAGGGGVAVSGGAAGTIPNTGGAGGGSAGTGGVTAGTARQDGSVGNIPSAGGSSGSVDARAGDAGKPSLHKSGCSCNLGGRGVAELGSR